MKKSIYGLDTIELTKRYRQHRNDMNHIANDTYKTVKQKSFEIKSKQLRFHKSLMKSEDKFIHELILIDLGLNPEEYL